MRTFEHPNMDNFKCPICNTSDDKEIVLIGIEGTEDGNNIQAEQIHLECLELRIVSLYPNNEGHLLYQKF